mgnify:CR=1 FL=1
MLQGSSILILFVKLATIFNLSDPGLLMMSPNLHNTSLITLASDHSVYLNVPLCSLSDIITTLLRLGTASLARSPGALVWSSGMISASILR